jgi:hypothetical protein
MTSEDHTQVMCEMERLYFLNSIPQDPLTDLHNALDNIQPLLPQAIREEVQRQLCNIYLDNGGAIAAGLDGFGYRLEKKVVEEIRTHFRLNTIPKNPTFNDILSIYDQLQIWVSPEDDDEELEFIKQNICFFYHARGGIIHYVPQNVLDVYYDGLEHKVLSDLMRYANREEMEAILREDDIVKRRESLYVVWYGNTKYGGKRSFHKKHFTNKEDANTFYNNTAHGWVNGGSGWMAKDGKGNQRIMVDVNNNNTIIVKTTKPTWENKLIDFLSN